MCTEEQSGWPSMRKHDRQKFRDITGQRFGRLVAISYIGPSNFGALWLCRCDCGTTKTVSRKSLERRSGPTRSCGCYRSEVAKRTFSRIRHHIPIVDLTGKRFGRLTVVRLAGTNRRGALWLCECDCGRQTVVWGYYLRRRHTNSCGCLQREVASAMRQRIAWERLERYVKPDSIFNLEVL